MWATLWVTGIECRVLQGQVLLTAETSFHPSAHQLLTPVYKASLQKRVEHKTCLLGICYMPSTVCVSTTCNREIWTRSLHTSAYKRCHWKGMTSVRFLLSLFRSSPAGSTPASDYSAGVRVRLLLHLPPFIPGSPWSSQVPLSPLSSGFHGTW